MALYLLVDVPLERLAAGVADENEAYIRGALRYYASGGVDQDKMSPARCESRR